MFDEYGQKIYNALEKKEVVNENELKEKMNKVDKNKILTILDKEYPDGFKNCYMECTQLITPP